MSPRRGRPLSLFARVALSNAAVFAAIALTLLLTPVTVSARVALTEGVVLLAGLAVALVVNIALLRSIFAPLGRLTRLMGRVDLLGPHEPVRASGPAEVMQLVDTFNQMLDRLEYERRDSGRRALLAQEGERKRIAQELHDEVGQTLTALLLQLGRAADRAPPELAGELGEAREAARASLQDVRRVARQLRPEALDDLGLVAALTSLCRAFSDRAGLRVERLLQPGLPPLDPESELVIYRVAQEGLTNAARHARAAHVAVRLEGHGEGVRLSVVDDGRGMGDRAPGAGEGLRGMRERAVSVGAELTLADAPGGGTEISLTVPARVGARSA